MKSILTSAIKPAANGCRNHRIALNSANEHTHWSTHDQWQQEDGSWLNTGGSYFTDPAEAMADYLERCKLHNIRALPIPTINEV